MIIEAVKCDECGCMKGESNHWWKAIVYPLFIMIGTESITTNHEVPIFDLCSSACVQKVLGRALDDFRKGEM